MNFKPFFLTSLAIFTGQATLTHSADVLQNRAGMSAGFQLNQNIQESLQRQTQPKNQNLYQAVQAPAFNDKEKDNTQQDMHFFIEKIHFSESDVLTTDDLHGLSAPYLERNLEIKQLNQLIDEINALYEAKACVVCRAFLLEQDLGDHVLDIRLVEGKTGQVLLSGQKHLKSSYILDRLPSLQIGKVARLNELNRDLRWFNLNEDANLSMMIKAGQEPQTTDYLVEVNEPKRTLGLISFDSLGYENTGIYRLSGTYLIKNMTGSADQLDINATVSEGSETLGLNYSYPISTKGTRLLLGYYGNQIEAVKGMSKEIELEGKSFAINTGINQVLMTGEKLQLKGQLDYRYLESNTDIIKLEWIDDRIHNYSLGISGQYLLDQSVINFSTAVHKGQTKNIHQEKQDFSTATAYVSYLQALDQKNAFQLKLNAQKSFNRHTPSSSQFAITGYYAARGYEDGLISTLSGAHLNFDYYHYFNDRLTLNHFSDIGWSDISDDQLLFSLGTELSWQPSKSTQLNMQLATPLIRDFNGMTFDSYTIKFRLSRFF